ncbi:MAG TPA: hypothetical protein VLK83_05325, partial [Rhodanobacteraceae bacterium]|nr:hypothetical protein [Rhodanobacteraceae bacterium]
LINAMARDKTIIVSTHLLEEVHAVCTRAIIIASGRILADATPGELEARSRYHQAVSLTAENVKAARDALSRASPMSPRSRSIRRTGASPHSRSQDARSSPQSATRSPARA